MHSTKSGGKLRGAHPKTRVSIPYLKHGLVFRREKNSEGKKGWNSATAKAKLRGLHLSYYTTSDITYTETTWYITYKATIVTFYFGLFVFSSFHPDNNALLHFIGWLVGSGVVVK